MVSSEDALMRYYSPGSPVGEIREHDGGRKQAQCFSGDLQSHYIVLRQDSQKGLYSRQSKVEGREPVSPNWVVHTTLGLGAPARNLLMLTSDYEGTATKFVSLVHRNIYNRYLQELESEIVVCPSIEHTRNFTLNVRQP